MENFMKKRITGKHITICEGPAGSGKSTLLSKLASLEGVDVISRSLQKRQFQTQEAGIKSFLNDNNKMMEALISEAPVVFIDRCVASQVIYHAIRTSKPPQGLDELWLRPILQLENLEADLAWRLDREPRKVKVYWMFLIPEEKVLIARRKVGGKFYPNRPLDEILYYKQASNALIMDGREAIQPAYNLPEDIDYIYRSFRQWLEYSPYLDFPNLWRSFATVPRAEECVDV